MKCYQCGSQSEQTQNFCRTCGTSLQIITKPLAEYAEVAEPENTPAHIPQTAGQRRRKLALAGMLIMFIGLALGVISTMIIHQEIIAASGVLISIIGMFLVAYSSLSSPRSKSNANTPAQPIYLPQENKLEYLPSITERTTSLLNHPAAKPDEQESKELHS